MPSKPTSSAARARVGAAVVRRQPVLPTSRSRAPGGRIGVESARRSQCRRRVRLGGCEPSSAARRERQQRHRPDALQRTARHRPRPRLEATRRAARSRRHRAPDRRAIGFADAPGQQVRRTPRPHTAHRDERPSTATDRDDLRPCPANRSPWSAGASDGVRRSRRPARRHRRLRAGRAGLRRPGRAVRRSTPPCLAGSRSPTCSFPAPGGPTSTTRLGEGNSITALIVAPATVDSASSSVSSSRLNEQEANPRSEPKKRSRSER